MNNLRLYTYFGSKVPYSPMLLVSQINQGLSNYPLIEQLEDDYSER